MKNNILDNIKNHKPIINGWLAIPSSITAESMSKMGWDSLTIDMQHGLNDYSNSIGMLQSINHETTTPLVRVPWNEPGIIMKMLDLGAVGIIAPMINTKKDCEKFVSYCNYPPIGRRSFGPIRAQLIYGQKYYSKANDNIISLAMIETKEAIENIDEILSVPNLKGVYVGPADMASSYGLGPKFDIEEDPVYSNIKLIAKKCADKKLIAGIHTGSTSYAKKMINLGYQFVSILSDLRSMSEHSQSLVDNMKKNNNSSETSSTY